MWQLVLNNIENFQNIEKNNVLSVYNGVGLQQYIKHITDQKQLSAHWTTDISLKRYIAEQIKWRDSIRCDIEMDKFL